MSRTFADSAFLARCQKAQTFMEEAGLAALLLTTAPELQYYSGFMTRFWESPTRPWFLILPVSGDPVAVIPSIGEALMRQTWVNDIRTWAAPNLADDGVSLLIDTLHELATGGLIGMAHGMESHARMPLATLASLQDSVQLVSDENITRRLRMVKTATEVDKLAAACAIADRAFARVPEIARDGSHLSEVFRRFQMLCLEEGADAVPYLAGAAAPDGYGDVISPASNQPLVHGDVLMLDTGLNRDGYFCDFDRNFSIGPPSAKIAAAHRQLIEATQAGFETAMPGARASDLFRAMDQVCTGGKGTSDAGRLGHGLGIQLTEWPSLIPDEHEELVPGMVLTLEPCVETIPGKLMVHEENIVITETGARYLSTPSTADITVIE